jgi:hypothetical protein
MGQLALHGASKGKICSFKQKAIVPSKKVIFYIQQL